MGKRREKLVSRSQTLPSSPSHSFSSSTSSDFEFTVSLSPRAATSSSLNPADHLFYKGQLLPLHLSPRLSMVRSLLLSSSSTTSTSSSSATAFRRDSTASSSNDSTTSCPSSSRPSSVSDDNINQLFSTNHHHHHQQQQQQQQQQQKQTKKNKFFSLSRFSSVFNKKHEHEQEQVNTTATSSSSSSVKRISTSAKQVFKKYLNKVKPLYEKPPQKQEEKVVGTGSNIEPAKLEAKKESNNGGSSHSFSGNLTYPRRRRRCISSCPSSMRSSPSHSRVHSRNGFTSMGMMNTGRVGSMHDPNHLSMEDLQSAIQGAIAHCKNSLVQKKITVVSNEV